MSIQIFEGYWSLSRDLIMLNEGGYFCTFTWIQGEGYRLWFRGQVIKDTMSND